MGSNDFHIESAHRIVNRLLPDMRVEEWFSDASMAVAVAAKCSPNPFGDEIRVVHVPSGEVIFRAEAGVSGQSAERKEEVDEP